MPLQPNITSEKYLEYANPTSSLHSAADFYATQQVLTQDFSSIVLQKGTTAWSQLKEKCSWMHISPDIQGIRNMIPFLQMFADQVITSILAVGGHPAKKRPIKNI